MLPAHCWSMMVPFLYPSLPFCLCWFPLSSHLLHHAFVISTIETFVSDASIARIFWLFSHGFLLYTCISCKWRSKYSTVRGAVYVGVFLPREIAGDYHSLPAGISLALPVSPCGWLWLSVAGCGWLYVRFFCVPSLRVLCVSAAHLLCAPFVLRSPQRSVYPAIVSTTAGIVHCIACASITTLCHDLLEWSLCVKLAS